MVWNNHALSVYDLGTGHYLLGRGGGRGATKWEGGGASEVLPLQKGEGGG